MWITYQSYRRDARAQLNHIKLYDLRHLFATRTYRKFKDILLVQRLLGHKNIRNTLRYIGLVNLDKQEFVVKAAIGVKDSAELLEQGFSFGAIIEEKYVFRKPK